jgi:hypothetical protein
MSALGAVGQAYRHSEAELLAHGSGLLTNLGNCLPETHARKAEKHRQLPESFLILYVYITQPHEACSHLLRWGSVGQQGREQTTRDNRCTLELLFAEA